MCSELPSYIGTMRCVFTNGIWRKFINSNLPQTQNYENAGAEHNRIEKNLIIYLKSISVASSLILYVQEVLTHLT